MECVRESSVDPFASTVLAARHERARVLSERAQLVARSIAVALIVIWRVLESGRVRVGQVDVAAGRARYQFFRIGLGKKFSAEYVGAMSCLYF